MAKRVPHWRAAFSIPCLIRWPGVIQPGTVYNNIMSQEDWMPTLLAAVGVPDIVEKLEAGYSARGKLGRSIPTATTFYLSSRVKQKRVRATPSSILGRAAS